MCVKHLRFCFWEQQSPIQPMNHPHNGVIRHVGIPFDNSVYCLCTKAMGAEGLVQASSPRVLGCVFLHKSQEQRVGEAAGQEGVMNI